MTVTAQDLKSNVGMLFDALSKGEDITITYRGKPKAKLISTQKSQLQKDDSLFGLWKDRSEDVDEMIRDMREGRSFDI